MNTIRATSVLPCAGTAGGAGLGGSAAGQPISRETVLSWLDVDIEAGTLFWRYRPDQSPQWNGQWSERRAGCVDSQGYRSVRLRGVLYREHRLIWLVAHGYLPKEIDHIDGDRLNNRLSNLREVSRKENLRNRGIDGRNNSGAVGVSYVKKTGNWRARIGIRGNAYTIGYFNTKEEAISARREEERKLGFHPNHGRRRAHT